MQRAYETAEIVSSVLSNSTLGCNIVTVEALKESNLGDLQGTTGPHLLGLLEEWRNGITPQRAETYYHFLKRIAAAFEEISLHVSCASGPVLIISHGGLYWGFSQLIIGLKKSYSLENCLPLYHRPPIAPGHPWVIYPLDDSYDL